MERTTRETLSSRICTDVREAILTGKIAPGERINIDALHVHYGISVSPIREAVARLVGSGLVEFEDQRGYRATKRADNDACELAELLAELEPLALAQGMANSSLEWESQIVGALHRLEHEASKADMTIGTCLNARMALHTALVRNATNKVLSTICVNLLEFQNRIVLLENPDISGFFQNLKNHKKIVELALAGNAESACAALREHIRRSV